METLRLTLPDIEELARAALQAAGATAAQARPLARAVAAAEADGSSSHGLAYVPTYCEHLRCGKVAGTAVPDVTQPAPSLVVVDAHSGFAHPAIEAGFERLVPLARRQGIAAMAVRNSYNCGALAFHAESLAREGLLGMAFTHAPASIAPAGGRKPVVGTNPFAVAVPGPAGSIALSIDQSASVVAKSEVIRRNREGRPIPEGWALGPEGEPTTDPAVALKGSMLPAGGYKGVGIALMVEILASAAAGACSSAKASPFSGPAGGPPRTGQFFIAIDAQLSSAGLFSANIEALVDALDAQEGVRVPGRRRFEARERAGRQGVDVSASLVAAIRAAMC